MATNSFLLRGWTVTLVAALFALAAKDADSRFVLVAYLPSILFWILDGYYLAQERRFRDLYAEVVKKSETEIVFSMDAGKFDRPWYCAFLSVTSCAFYGFMFSSILFVMNVVH